MNKISKRFVFTVGPSGSGKSTLYPHGFEADKYPNLYSKNGVINKKLLSKAHHKCLEDCIQAMVQQDTFVVQTNTNLNPETKTTYDNTLIERDFKDPLPTINANFRVIGRTERSNTDYLNHNNVQYKHSTKYDEEYEDEYDEEYDDKIQENKIINNEKSISSDWNDESYSRW